LPDPLPGEGRDRSTPARLLALEQKATVPTPSKPGPDSFFGRLLRGGILIALVLGGAALMLFAFMPAVTAALALMLVPLSPVVLWALFVFATLDTDRQTTKRALNMDAAQINADRRHHQHGSPALQLAYPSSPRS
jgi:hypothetical protein